MDVLTATATALVSDVQRHTASVLDSAHDAFVAIDEHGRITAFNAAATTLFGWTRDEAVGMRIDEAIVPERLREAYRLGLEPFLERGDGRVVGRPVELTARHRDGHELPVELTLAELPVEGRTTFNAFLRDITARRQAEEHARRVAAIVESSADAIMSIDSDGVVTSWNPAAERVYGRPAAEAIGQLAKIVAPPANQLERWQDMHARVLAGETVRDVAGQVRNAARELREVEATGSPLRTVLGAVDGVSIVVRDVTERRQAERDLAEHAARLRELDRHRTAACDAATAGGPERDVERRGLSPGSDGLRALLAAVDARDAYTGEHSRTVVQLAAAVGRQLRLAGSEILAVEQVALLHDLGKVGVPDAVLQKRGPLDEREWQLMREHPAIGARIVASIPSLRELAPAVRAEHERWDGRGYPDGLSGDAIPVASRITLACDAYHAMTSDRPYRRAIAPEAAREELRRCAGTQFDPAVVAALLAVLAT